MCLYCVMLYVPLVIKLPVRQPDLTALQFSYTDTNTSMINGGTAPGTRGVDNGSDNTIVLREHLWDHLDEIINET